MKTFKQYQNYIIIGIVSLFSVCFLPFLGSEVGLGFVLPNTISGWIVYISCKVMVAIINMLIFHCFNTQGKDNCKENARYLEACEILINNKDKQTTPRSPTQWNIKQYGFKGLTLAITTMLSAIGLTQAILVFDYTTMLTYIFTIAMGVVFGIIQMGTAEEYWTTEYWQYAKMVDEQNKQKELLKQSEDLEMAKSKHSKQADDNSRTSG